MRLCFGSFGIHRGFEAWKGGSDFRLPSRAFPDMEELGGLRGYNPSILCFRVGGGSVGITPAYCALEFKA